MMLRMLHIFAGHQHEMEVQHMCCTNVTKKDVYRVKYTGPNTVHHEQPSARFSSEKKARFSSEKKVLPDLF